MTSTLIAYYVTGIAATAIAAVLAFVIAQRREWVMPRWVLLGAIAFVPVSLLIQQLLKYASLHMYADFSHWLQVLHAIAATGKPHVWSHEFFAPGTLNYLSVHFVSLIYLFALPFKLLSYPQTLIVCNVVIMSSAAIPFYLLVKHRIGDRRVALLFAALLLWYPTFQYATLYEFEMLRFSIPILFWMLYAWERQWIAWYYVFVFLAVLVREEVGLTVGVFGVYLFLFQRRRMHGVATTILGFTAFAVITQLVMPALRGPGAEAHIAQGFFSAFGATPIAVIFGILRHPFRALAFAVDSIKIANLGMLFLPLLFLPLLAPVALLPALATFAIGLVSSSTSYTHTSYLLYYVAPAVPFVFIAAVTAWPRWMAWFARRIGLRDDGRVGTAIMCMCAGILSSQIFFGPSSLSLQFWSEHFRPAPFKTQSFHRSAYHVTDHHRAIREIVSHIPADAIVSTQQFLMPRFSSRRGVMVFPQLTSKDGVHRAEYVLLDATNNGLPEGSPAFVTSTTMDMVRRDLEHWELIQSLDAYAIYRLRS